MLFQSKNHIKLVLWLVILPIMMAASDNTLYFTNPKFDWVSFFKQITADYNIEVFIESGTYHGSTSAKAAQFFKEVHTIELLKELFEKAQARFKNSKNVFLYLGDSGEILPKILPTIPHKILFWLDGHYMGGKTDEATPIIKELDGLKKTNKLDEFILIDDARLFGTKLGSKILFGDKHYPLLEDVCSYLKNANPNITLAIMGDSLLAFDSNKNNINLSSLTHACYISRLYNGANYSDQEILSAEKSIAQASGAEKEVLIRLYSLYSTGKLVHCYHYILWNSLILAQTQQFDESNSLLNKLITAGYDHWRVEWYLAQNLYHQKKFEQCKQSINKVLAIAPHFSNAHVLLKQVVKNLTQQ